MEISFDPKKDERTKRERGISLSLGAEVIRNKVAVRMDMRFDYGEERLIAYGHVEERLYVCVYTVRGDALRIISVRKANGREVARYGR